jgi:hypothetical protein
VKRDDILTSIPKITSDLNARRKWYQGSVDAALSNNPNALKDLEGSSTPLPKLEDNEVSLYREFDNDREGKAFQNKITQLEKQYPWIQKPGEGGAAKARTGGTLIENPIVTEAKAKLKEYLKVKDKVNERRSNFLAQVRYSPFETDAIQVGKEGATYVAQSLFKDLQGVKFFDHTGNKAGKITIGDKEFEVTGVDNTLQNFMIDNSITPIIEQVGNTTAIGTGNAIVKLNFKDKEGKVTMNPVYAELTPELQKKIGAKLSTDKNPEVNKIANSLLDEEGNSIRNQLATPTIGKTAGISGNYDPVKFNIFIGEGNQKVPFEVSKFISADGKDHLLITGTDATTGLQIPLGQKDSRFLPESGIPGWFNGAEDFINYIKKQRTSK